MIEKGDYKVGATVSFKWPTNDKNGGAIAPSVAGTLRCYKEDGTDEVTAPTGITDTRAFDGNVGVHDCKIDLTANPFYEKGKDYSVVLVGATIDGETVNTPIASFSIENRWVNIHYHYGGK
jgi:hypothetical protein